MEGERTRYFSVPGDNSVVLCHDGVLVVDHVLTPSQVDLLSETLETVARHMVDTDHLVTGGEHKISAHDKPWKWRGVLILFYERIGRWKLHLNPRLWRLSLTQLWVGIRPLWRK
jgi:hypothetical protein